MRVHAPRGRSLLALPLLIGLLAALPAAGQAPVPAPPAATVEATLPAVTAEVALPAATVEVALPAAAAEAAPAPEAFAFAQPPEVIDQSKGCHGFSVAVSTNRPASVEVALYAYTPAEIAAIEQAEAARAKGESRLTLKESEMARKSFDFIRGDGLLPLPIPTTVLVHSSTEIALAAQVCAGERQALDAAIAAARAAANAAAGTRPPVKTGLLNLAGGDKPGPIAGEAKFAGLSAATPLFVRVTARNPAGETATAEFATATQTIFKPYSLQVAVITVLLVFLIMLSIKQAETGRFFYIRKIAGLNAIEEAVGRATEMGKPVLYLTGLHELSSISTLASISILGHVARKTAEYETPILVPNCRSMVMVTAREVVKEAYLSAGKADHFHEDSVSFLTEDQFGFVSGVDGIMVREKPAACFYLGQFMAESLIYAETGHSVGAIQVAGTAEFSQIPFFITACDYTLIGEELFAAGAYLARKPRDVGSLRGQDLGKLLIIVTIIAGVAIQSCAYVTGNPGLLAFSEWFVAN